MKKVLLDFDIGTEIDDAIALAYLLAVAPMTNLGLHFAMEPELPELLDGLYLLCGSPTHQRHDVVTESLSAMERDDFIRVLASQGILENNSIVDPHATSIVYRARCRNFVNIGNNVSSRVVMTPEEAERRFRHPIMQVVMSIAREWFKDEPRVSFHDPLAAVCIFNDDVCSYKRGYMDCVLDSRLLGGMTIFREDPAGPHQVAWDVDGDKFFEHLFEVFA